MEITHLSSSRPKAPTPDSAKKSLKRNKKNKSKKLSMYRNTRSQTPYLSKRAIAARKRNKVKRSSTSIRNKAISSQKRGVNSSSCSNSTTTSTCRPQTVIKGEEGRHGLYTRNPSRLDSDSIGESTDDDIAAVP